MKDLSSNVSNLCDLIDTRQVIERIEELENDHTDWEGGEDATMAPAESWPKDDREEYAELSQLVKEVSEYAEDFRYGVTLIRETYFVEHITEEYGDVGGEYYETNHRYPGRDEKEYRLIPWDELMSRAPFNCIDWEAVAAEERSDYYQFDYDGIVYYYR